MIPKSYAIYKGLQKPLTYRGFKGKYIYWGLASLLLGLILGSIAAALSNIILSALTTLITMASAFAYTIIKQKKGLYDKIIYQGIFVHKPLISIYYEKRQEDNF